MLINAVPLICQQRLALVLLNPSGYTVNPYAPVVPPTRERPGAPPSITPAARIAIQLHAALCVGLLLPLLLPQHLYAPDRVLQFPAPPEYEIPLQMLSLGTGCANSYAACCCSSDCSTYTWSNTV